MNLFIQYLAILLNFIMNYSTVFYHKDNDFNKITKQINVEREVERCLIIIIFQFQVIALISLIFLNCCWLKRNFHLFQLAAAYINLQK